MKIAILGATGLTGKQVVQQALDADHEVLAIVRTPEKMSIQHDHLTVVVGNIFNADDLKQHIEGVDAVISTIGFPPFPRTCT